MKKTIILLGIIIQICIACSGRFVKRDELKYLRTQYKGVFISIKDIDIGNNQTLKKGTKIKLYFRSGGESVKVYAYLFGKSRESAEGKNILYLFESDFTKAKLKEEGYKFDKSRFIDEEYNRTYFQSRLDYLVKKF